MYEVALPPRSKIGPENALIGTTRAIDGTF